MRPGAAGFKNGLPKIGGWMHSVFSFGIRHRLAFTVAGSVPAAHPLPGKLTGFQNNTGIGVALGPPHDYLKISIPRNVRGR